MRKKTASCSVVFLIYLLPFFFFLIIWSWRNELVGYECCYLVNRSCGHGWHASKRLRGTGMCPKERPAMSQASTGLSQVEGKLRECLQSQCPKLEFCSFFQLNQYINQFA